MATTRGRFRAISSGIRRRSVSATASFVFSGSSSSGDVACRINAAGVYYISGNDNATDKGPTTYRIWPLVSGQFTGSEYLVDESSHSNLALSRGAIYFAMLSFPFSLSLFSLRVFDGQNERGIENVHQSANHISALCHSLPSSLRSFGFPISIAPRKKKF